MSRERHSKCVRRRTKRGPSHNTSGLTILRRFACSCYSSCYYAYCCYHGYGQLDRHSQCSSPGLGPVESVVFSVSLDIHRTRLSTETQVNVCNHTPISPHADRRSSSQLTSAVRRPHAQKRFSHPAASLRHTLTYIGRSLKTCSPIRRRTVRRTSPHSFRDRARDKILT